MKEKKPNLMISKNILLVILSGMAILIISCFAGIASYFVAHQLTVSLAQRSNQGPDLSSVSTTPRLNAEGTPLPSIPGELSANDPLITGAQLTPWDGAGRVTLLLLGVDYRDWEAQTEASRSDTMILLTLDPQTKTAGILSIPRDLWVSIPGFQHGKINTAYYLGDAYQLPGGGPGSQ